MKMITTSRPMTIKEKKESLILSRTRKASGVATPVESYTLETPCKQLRSSSKTTIKRLNSSAMHVTLTEQKQRSSRANSKDKSELCQSLRRIKSINQLSFIHDHQAVSKSKYRFKAESLTDSVKSTTLTKKRSDKIPINILAIQESVHQSSHRAVTEKQRMVNSRFCASKVIKSLIIRYPQNEELK